jgi:2-C-methyl-D-erythritol 4-phosphate cytidylyltransferase
LQQGAADAVGALLATPVADTVKRARGAEPASPAGAVHCEATLSRQGLWLAQTPQMFRLGPLRQALEQALAQGRRPTDEAQVMEWEGHAALLVPSHDPNHKVTTQADLRLAEAILLQRANQ